MTQVYFCISWFLLACNAEVTFLGDLGIDEITEVINVLHDPKVVLIRLLPQ